MREEESGYAFACALCLVRGLLASRGSLAAHKPGSMHSTSLVVLDLVLCARYQCVRMHCDVKSVLVCARSTCTRGSEAGECERLRGNVHTLFATDLLSASARACQAVRCTHSLHALKHFIVVVVGMYVCVGQQHCAGVCLAETPRPRATPRAASDGGVHARSSASLANANDQASKQAVHRACMHACMTH